MEYILVSLLIILGVLLCGLKKINLILRKHT